MIVTATAAVIVTVAPPHPSKASHVPEAVGLLGAGSDGEKERKSEGVRWPAGAGGEVEIA